MNEINYSSNQEFSKTGTESELSKAIGIVDTGLLQLSEIISQLDSRLKPLQKIVPISDNPSGSGNSDVNSHSPLVSTIKSFDHRLLNNISHLEILLSLIQI